MYHQSTQILRIARAGNPARALRLFDEQGLDQRKDDPKLLTLHGRLLKDHAHLSSGDERGALFTSASEAYLAAFDQAPDSYPLINAATLALLAGDATRSQRLAGQVLDMIEADPQEGETPYWREATRSEALLLLRRTGEAEAALAEAIANLPLAHEDLAATIGQFERIIDAQSSDLSWLEKYRPPSSLHFSGLIELDPYAPGLREAITEKIAHLRPGYAFGALAAGADIMIAEAALAASAQLHVVLPSSLKAFRASSVEPYGADWAARFDALIEQATSLEALAEPINDIDCPFALRVELASLAAMGLCVRQGENLNSKSHALTIKAPGEEERPHVRRWLQSGRAIHRLEIERGEGSQNSKLLASKYRLAALTLVGECDQAKIVSLAEKHSLISHADHPANMFLGEPDAALHFVSECLEMSTDCRVSMIIDVVNMQDPDEAFQDRLNCIARTENFTQVMADRQTALVAQALDQSFKSEEAGELATLYGSMSLWSVNLT